MAASQVAERSHDHSQRAYVDLFSLETPNSEPIFSHAGSPRRVTYVNSLAIDISTGRGSRGRSVGDSVSARLADVNLGGRDFQSSAGHLKQRRRDSEREVITELGYLLPKFSFIA